MIHKSAELGIIFQDIFIASCSYRCFYDIIYFLFVVCSFTYFIPLAGGVKNMMDMVAALSTQTNGLSGVKVMVGRSGVTNGMKILIQMVMVSSRGRHGGKVSMETAGIVLGVRVTMDLDGFTSMERAAVGSTGTHISKKIHGMRDSHTLAFITALTTQFSSGKFGNLPSLLNHNFLWS